MFTDYFDQFLILSVFGVSLNLLTGIAGQVSIAHGAFGAVGGFVAGYLSIRYGWSVVPAVLIAVPAGAIFGAMVSIPALRLGTEHLILLTLAIQTATIAVIMAIPALGGQFGLVGLPFPKIFGKTLLRPPDWVPFLAVVASIVFLLCLAIDRSPVGRVLRGIREDELATESLGKNVFGYKVAIFALTAGLAALGGALYAFYNGIATPSLFDINLSISVIVIVIVGGSGNLLGSLCGTAFVVASTPFFQSVIHLSADSTSSARLIAYGLVLIAILLLRPQGLLPEGVVVRRGLRRPAEERTPAGGARRHSVAEREPRAARLATGDRILDVRGLSKRFGGIHAVSELSFSLRCGEITGLIGPNGAGKTTVFNLLTGALKPDSGTVMLDGRDVTSWSMNRAAKAGMVRSFQDVRVFGGLTALDNVKLGAANRETAWAQLETVGLAAKAKAITSDLAFGERKLVALARVLATGARVVLLDEPASGIDAGWVDRMLDVIESLRSPNVAICIVEHNLQVIERLADHVYFMENGSVTAEGTMEELARDARLTEAYFGHAR